MPATIDKKCKHCKSDITVRLADHNRGWGNFCNKSCKAKFQEKSNGQYSAYMNGRGVSNLHPERLKDYSRSKDWDEYDDYDDSEDDTHPFSSDALGQW